MVVKRREAVMFICILPCFTLDVFVGFRKLDPCSYMFVKILKLNTLIRWTAILKINPTVVYSSFITPTCPNLKDILSTKYSTIHPMIHLLTSRFHQRQQNFAARRKTSIRPEDLIVRNAICRGAAVGQHGRLTASLVDLRQLPRFKVPL